ncbi:PorT family protein [Mucilaginibacter sp. 14171R-50]|uniref:porin family protein n=1 Tax=Mucilaginibacter sp. 14171R-50 TaxID=2703789 RepID=UPI00138D79FA|nr:porin family protein [Mucilaginibacter sp. 14171R-50]QHS57270.1 PorT family protein [Mucilaginibacter sp. 14171R-50]
MNKFFTSVLIILAASTAAFSQSKGKTELGLNVGLNIANVSASGVNNDDPRIGFNLGVSADHYFSETWSFKAKVSYDQKGWNNGYLNNFTTNYQVNYITIPVMANWHFGGTKNWYLNFGPYVGILLNATETADGTDLKPIFNSTDFGADLGIGVKFPLAEKAKLFIELNGQAGINDIAKNNTGSTLRNSVSAINIGVNF